MVMDKLILRKVIGGSIIERPPVFSSDGKHLCVVEKDCVRAYSTLTGELSFELHPVSGIDCDVVGIVAHGNYLYGISSKGILMKWSLKSSSRVEVLKLQLPHKNFTVFNLVCLDNDDEVDEKTPIRLALLMSNDNDELDTNRVTICSCSVLNVIKKISHFSVVANNNIRSLTFGGRYDNIFVGTILKNEIRIYWYGHNRHIACIKASDQLTVIRAHPTEDSIVVGNTRGQIFIYHNVTSGMKQKGSTHTRTLYAWHILPIMDVIFSGSGTQFYSGGSECVLVQWPVSKSELRRFLPRLAAPIVLLSVSPTNLQIAVSLLNNSILLLNPQLETECSIQQFTWGLIPVAGQDLFPGGICRDPNSGCLILNGRPGHIQFFSLSTTSLLYNLDITETNYLTQEPGVEIFNLEVTRFAFSHDGKWLATVESRYDHEISPEIRMKIWIFNESNHKFKLNTYCDVPHEDTINTVKFQPIYSSDNEKRTEYCLVTTGNDKKFRVWLSVLTQVGNKKNTVWKCERIGYYQDYPAGPAGFSSDGSVLAVGFGPCLTIWDIDSHELVASLTRDSEYLTFVEIEQTNYSHLVVGTSSSKLCVWNLLTLTLLWTVPLKVTVLVADPLSDYMAAFTHDNVLFVFLPSNSQPVYEKSDVCSDGKTLAAIFVPQDDATKTDGLPKWMHRSQLYFVTSGQELMCVEMDNESEYKSSLKKFNRNDEDLIRTPFAALKAKQTKYEDNSSSVIKNRPLVGLVTDHVVAKLLSNPIHTMPPIKLFCNDFLKSLINKSSDKRSIIKVKPVKNKNKKNKKKLKEDYERRLHEDFRRIFVDNNNASNADDLSSHGHDLLSDSTSPLDLNDFGDNMDIDDEDSCDNKNNESLEGVQLNRMFTNMKSKSNRNKSIKAKKKKKKVKRDIMTSGNKFVVDDAPDFGLLNLFKEGD